MKIVVQSLLITLIGVFVIDYFSHLLFSNPMETFGYFAAKSVLYFIFAIVFLSFFNLAEKEFGKVLIGGISVALFWGAYYNVFPLIFDYYPFGIALNGLTFLGMGLLGTGLAFGAVHTLAFVGGYYSSKFVLENFS